MLLTYCMSIKIHQCMYVDQLISVDIQYIILINILYADQHFVCWSTFCQLSKFLSIKKLCVDQLLCLIATWHQYPDRSMTGFRGSFLVSFVLFHLVGIHLVLFVQDKNICKYVHSAVNVHLFKSDILIYIITCFSFHPPSSFYDILHHYRQKWRIKG